MTMPTTRRRALYPAGQRSDVTICSNSLPQPSARLKRPVRRRTRYAERPASSALVSSPALWVFVSLGFWSRTP